MEIRLFVYFLLKFKYLNKKKIHNKNFLLNLKKSILIFIEFKIQDFG
jgi:hypothetical protein